MKSMEDIIRSLWYLPRDLVSDGYDKAIYALSTVVPMVVHEYPTGTECFTWIVPEKWTCREARLETMDGTVLFSYADNPLHAMSYSLPFSDVVDRETLFAHLYSRPDIPDAIPFMFKYYARGWGLCCSHNQKQTLTDDNYRVVIETELTEGFLKVGEVVVEGECDDTYVFCAHLCHPAQTNDDMVGVALGVDVFRRLLEGPKPRYTYRLVILPETIGSAAWLSHNEALIPKMKGGLFLEMLGTPHPHSLQRSDTPDSHADRLIEHIVRHRDPKCWVNDFMKVVLNDERMFNGPGINVPMLSLSRIPEKDLHSFPYPEYHTSHDTPDSVDWDNLRNSREVVLEIIRALEENQVPVPRFKGELFCSRFKSIDYGTMFTIMNAVVYKLDGVRNVADIAIETDHSFWDVLSFLNIMEGESLIYWK